MKKSILVLGILVRMVGATEAQEIEPIRIEAVGGLGFSLGFEYAIPISQMSASIDMMVGMQADMPGRRTDILAGAIDIRCYLFNPQATGFYLKTGYGIIHATDFDGEPFLDQSVMAGLGYRWILFKHFTILLGFTPRWEFYSTGTSAFAYNADISIGIAF
jgi:hypothetical protein